MRRARCAWAGTGWSAAADARAGNGSAVRFDPEKHRYLFDGFGEYITGEIQWKGEQKYTSMTALTHGDLEYFPEGWICSFKRQSIPLFPANFVLKPNLPADCRVMCFHGAENGRSAGGRLSQTAISHAAGGLAA
ncbi:MAG: hypothetical protein R3D34_19190 [Nitratireductor sp.]